MAAPRHHAKLTTPEPELLPAEIRDEAADVAAARAEWHAARTHTAKIRQQLGEAQAAYERAVREGGALKADRRPSLKQELALAQDREKHRRDLARRAWHVLDQKVRELDAGCLDALEGDAQQAADDYRAAIEATREARARMHEALSVRRWLQGSIAPGQRAPGTPRPALKDFDPGRYSRSTTVQMRDAQGRRTTGDTDHALATLMADTEAAQGLRAVADRNLRWESRESAARNWQGNVAAELADRAIQRERAARTGLI